MGICMGIDIKTIFDLVGTDNEENEEDVSSSEQKEEVKAH